MKKSTLRNDLLLILILLLAAGAAYAGIRKYQELTTENAEACVTLDGEEIGQYPLSEDLEERLEFEDSTYNLLVIRDGRAMVTEADCPDQICVNHRGIYRTGQSIICLPHRLVIEIVNGEAPEVDAVTH